jgi:hypothetical protein
MNLDPTTASTMKDAAQRSALLRQTVNEVVGVTFFQPMLKAAHSSVLKGKYGHGGRGEEIFQGQLDAQLATYMGRGVRTGMGEALYRKLTRGA